MESSEGAAGEAGDASTTVHAQSLYAALGLSPEDVEALAKIPENEISVETLPYLIMQLKAKREEKESVSAVTNTDTEQTPGKPPEEEEPPQQANQEPPEKIKEKRPSPPSSSASRRSEGHASNHDHEHHGKYESYRRTERPAPGRRDFRHRKSSRERLSSDTLDTEFDDNPSVFPHVCSVCKIKINDPKAWTGHLRGARHLEARRELMRFSSPYSEEDLYSSRRSSRSSLPSKRPYSSERSTGDVSSSDRHFSHYKPFTRVVVAKFPMGCVAVADMLALGKPFGTIVKHLIFPFKGFLEFSSHGEAKDMVNHYQTKPAFIKGHRISLCLSPTVEVIHPPEVYDSSAKRQKPSSQSVVCFSRLPSGKEMEEEVLEIAAMFGDVRQSKFSEDKALIEMVDWRDADIMVKYYHTNPLRIQDKSIKVSLSSLSSLRESSPEHPSSKKSHSSCSRQKNEPSSSKSSSQPSGRDKEKRKSSSREPSTAESKQEKDTDKEMEGEDGEKDKEEEEDRQGDEAEKMEENVENEEGVQREDNQGLLETENMETATEETEQKEGEEEEAESKEDKHEEEEQVAVEGDENKGDKVSEENTEEQDDLDEVDFPENLDDFVTLDELDSTTGGDSLETSEPKEGRVVVVRPIRKEFRETRKKVVPEALYNMATPFGKVVNFAISYYRHEALIELETVEKAHEMVNFYKNRKKSKLLGRPVSVSICLAFDRIEGPSGRSLFISMLPSFKYSDMSLLRLAQPFGKITAYCSNRMYGTCYIQMETKEAAEKMLQKFLHRPLKFYGSVLKITMCRKGDSHIPWTPANKFDRWCDTRGIKPSRDGEERTENGQTSKNSPREDRHSPEMSLEGVGGDRVCEGEDSEEEEKARSPLGPYQSDNPVGVDYVVPKSGFFCKLCNVFYTDEKRAKSDHCSSLEHYNKLKKKRGEVEEEVQEEEQTDRQTDEQMNE
ncbi:matrin-3 [Hoplias malabaricus]|uniref:matrin-3 n=1 Tax=Hoplias malabaricus TaxID=27720 RepID=UPI0034637045